MEYRALLIKEAHPKTVVNPAGNIVRPGNETMPNPGTETLMNAPTSLAAEKSLPAGSEAERPSQLETDAERIKSSVARLTANSIDGLEGLTSELQQLQKFLKSEVERVQGDIESALAGINIIVETIAPWKSPVSLAAPSNSRPVRSGPAAAVDVAQPRR